MKDTLTGTTALVTGASRGIGRAVAIALAEAGADVAVNFHRNETAAREVCTQIEDTGRRALAVQADVSNPDDINRMLDVIRLELGPITILVNNAGIALARTLENITGRDWDEVLATNLKAPFLVTQAVLPDMRSARWGRIIGLSSVAAQLGGAVGAHYAASKAGVIGLMHYYAAILAREGITANAIAPGPINTDMVAGLSQLNPEQIPVGRFGTTGEIAQVAVMLARNGYLTGQTINVNGGRYPG